MHAEARPKIIPGKPGVVAKRGAKNQCAIAFGLWGGVRRGVEAFPDLGTGYNFSKRPRTTGGTMCLEARPKIMLTGPKAWAREALKTSLL